MSDFKGSGTGDDSGRSQVERKQSQLLSDLSKGLDMQHHNTSLMHEFGSAFDAPSDVTPATSGAGSVGQAPSPARSDHQHGPEVPTFVIPALLNSWANYGGGWPTARYYKMNGRVWLEGLIRLGSTAAAIMLNIGVGFRPPTNLMFPSLNASGTGIILTRIVVNANGDVNQDMGAIALTNTWVMLAGNWIPA